MSFLDRFTHAEPSGMVTYIPGVAYRFSNKTCEAGHIRLFRKPNGGLKVFHWNRTAPDWALTRCWTILGIATIIHIEKGEHLKRCHRSGWHVRWFKLRFKAASNSLTASIHTADKGYGF